MSSCINHSRAKYTVSKYAAILSAVSNSIVHIHVCVCVQHNIICKTKRKPACHIISSVEALLWRLLSNLSCKHLYYLMKNLLNSHFCLPWAEICALCYGLQKLNYIRVYAITRSGPSRRRPFLFFPCVHRFSNESNVQLSFLKAVATIFRDLNFYIYVSVVVNRRGSAAILVCHHTGTGSW